uniref:Cell adhesion molecule 2a n=1 Tax=Salmo trutta TaxID=8032 RepID=A0A673XKU6_SALTR
VNAHISNIFILYSVALSSLSSLLSNLDIVIVSDNIHYSILCFLLSLSLSLSLSVFLSLALRDNRIELVRASWSELTISISEITLADEGMYTCSLFTMPVKTAKAYLTVLGVPEKPEIDGLTKPALEGDEITLTCMTHGSKPAADLRWFRNEKEIKGAKEVNASGKTFTVTSSLQLLVDRDDDGAAYTCKVDHAALLQTPQQATEVLEVHYAPRVLITRSLAFPQEGQYLRLECVSKGNPSPDPVLWTKDGGELPDLERMIVQGRELTFSALNKTDNGTYRCVASNHLGTSSAEYILYVYDTVYQNILQPSDELDATRYIRTSSSHQINKRLDQESGEHQEEGKEVYNTHILFEKMYFKHLIIILESFSELSIFPLKLDTFKSEMTTYAHISVDKFEMFTILQPHTLVVYQNNGSEASKSFQTP